MLRPPGGGCGLELARFVRPDHDTRIAHRHGQRAGSAQHLLRGRGPAGAVDGLLANGYGPLGSIGRYEDTWLMAHVRGPEGIVVALTERIG